MDSLLPKQRQARYFTRSFLCRRANDMPRADTSVSDMPRTAGGLIESTGRQRPRYQQQHF